MAHDPRAAADDDFPWWLVVAGLIGVWLAWRIGSDAVYAQIAATVAKGVGVTIYVTVVAFALAATLGLLIAVAGLSGSRILRQAARFYVEVVRGVPILVLLFYVAFVAAPAFVAGWNAAVERIGLAPIQTRDVSLMWRAIVALAIGYSAFVAEVFRAGIQSVDRGQIEAAESLGLGRALRFRLVVLPQTLRTILPPLGNDFIALVKDSSLVSVLGVADVTQLGKIYAAGSFRFFETYNVVAYFYLLLTIGLSLILRRLERRLRGRAGGAG